VEPPEISLRSKILAAPLSPEIYAPRNCPEFVEFEAFKTANRIDFPIRQKKKLKMLLKKYRKRFIYNLLV